MIKPILDDLDDLIELAYIEAKRDFKILPPFERTESTFTWLVQGQVFSVFCGEKCMPLVKAIAESLNSRMNEESAPDYDLIGKDS